MPNKTPSNFCRVCGLDQGEPPWGDNDNNPTFAICDCCGVEFGYEDCSIEAIRNFRKNWLQDGSPWNEPKKKPINWSLEKQINNVPPKYR